MSEVVAALKALVLATGHDIKCLRLEGERTLPCTCGKVHQLRDAHGEACRVLRALGEIK